MINFKRTPNFAGRFKKEKPEPKIIDKTPENKEVEEDTFESTARANKKEDTKFMCNLVGKTLLSLGVISAPIVCANIIDDNDFTNGVIVAEQVLDEDDLKILEKADSLAKGGKQGNVLEAHEFCQLLDFSPLNTIPKLSREGAKIASTANFLPINMTKLDSEEEILKQVKTSQYMINRLAEGYEKNPPKTSQDQYMDYVINNITPDEILEKVDFSELEQYQKDLTITKGIMSFSLNKIRRDDEDAFKKKEKAIEDAQRFVDGIVNKYKMRAKVSGNYNGDDVLSKSELATLLNTQSLMGLPDNIAFRIIAKALEDDKPIETRYATDDRQVEITNEKVEESRQKAQEKLDEWAIKAQDYFFPILHPDELRVKNKISG